MCPCRLGGLRLHRLQNIVGFTGTFAKRAGHFSRGGQTFTQGITSWMKATGDQQR